MSTLNGQWLDVFRAGDYGEKGRYSVADLASMCANYNPSIDEVPLVIGHPQSDKDPKKDDATRFRDPAYGWAKAFRMNGDVLQALPGEVDPDFEESVKAGRYKKRSVAFKENADGTLKMPLELRHIGWLGASMPAIKGLRDAKFSDRHYTEIEFSETPKGEVMENNKTIREEISAFFAELFGKNNPAPTGLTPAQLEAAVNKAIEGAKAQFSDELKAERELRQAAEKKFSDFQLEFSATNGNARAAKLIADLKAEKHWIPAFDKMGVSALFAALAVDHPIEITFADNQKKDAAQLLADVLHGIGKIVPEGAVFTAEGTLEIPKPQPDGNGTPVDQGSAIFHEKVVARAKEKNISYNDATKQLNAEGVSSSTFGAASAGAV